MDKEEVIGKLLKFADEINKHFILKKLILYGSYARGNQNNFSDIDVAVVVDKFNDNYFNDLKFLWQLGGDIDSRIEPVLFADNKKDLSGFLEDIINHGTIVYSTSN